MTENIVGLHTSFFAVLREVFAVNGVIQIRETIECYYMLVL